MKAINTEFCNELKNYLEIYKPIGEHGILNVEQIIDGDSSNHLNFKVSTSNKKYLARVTKPENILSYSNLADEFTILKLVEQYDIGPKGITIDLEYFQTPLLIEEYIEGEIFSNLKKASADVFENTLDLIIRTSNIKIDSSEFPFKFKYTTYSTSFRMWVTRMKELTSTLGVESSIIKDFEKVIAAATLYLEPKDYLLRQSTQEFIYNDVHPGNLINIERDGKVKFIDWQKVSIGDPSFMVALFARRFAHVWDMGTHDFLDKTLKSYASVKKVENFNILFWSRILERSVSDMIWGVWSNTKSGRPIEINSATENKYYIESVELLNKLG